MVCGRSWVREVNFQWDDDEVRFILDQHAGLDLYSASSLKQQSVGKHVVPLGHIVMIPSRINLFSPWYCWKIAELALSNNHSLTLLSIILSVLLRLTASDYIFKPGMVEIVSIGIIDRCNTRPPNRTNMLSIKIWHFNDLLSSWLCLLLDFEWLLTK
jgi:hypothetical protein